MSPAKRQPKDNEDSFISFDEAPQMPDPAVSALLARTERRQAEAHLTHKEREKKKKEREKIRARRPYHTTYDLPVELRQRIKDLAEQHGVPASQLATLGLLRLVEDLAARRLDLGAQKVPSRSPRYDYNLVIAPEDYPATFGKNRKKGRP